MNAARAVSSGAEDALLSPRGTLSVTLDADALEAFERDFARCVGAEHLFVPGVDAVSVGARVRVELRLRTGAICLAVEGVVLWRYPVGLIPPGREAGVGLHIDAADATSGERLARLRAREGAGAFARMPGTHLSPLERRPVRRPLPELGPFPQIPTGLPELSGVTFLVRSGPRQSRDAITHLRPLQWPTEGGRQRSGRAEPNEPSDARTAPSPGFGRERPSRAVCLEAGADVFATASAATMFDEPAAPDSRNPKPLGRAQRASQEAGAPRAGLGGSRRHFPKG